MRKYITFTQDKKTGEIFEREHQEENINIARQQGRKISKENSHKYLTTKVSKTI